MENSKDHKQDKLSEISKNKEIEKKSSSISSDKQSAQVMEQSIKDDPSLAAVAKDIHVTVKDGAVTLDGKVSTEKQIDLAASTAAAVGAVDEIDNRIELKSKESKVNSKQKGTSSMKINALIMSFAIMAAALSVHADQAPIVRQVSGEIGWVDVQSGKLELNKETKEGTKTTAYRITQNETRVTDSADEKFLGVDDLRAGQYVTIDVVDGQEDKVISKLVVDPMPASKFQQAFGEIKEVNSAAGTLVVEERVRIDQTEQSRLSYFVFDPKSVVIMRAPSKQPTELTLKPGDVVKVEYAELDGKQQAQYITLYSPTVTSTTTTTTVTTIQ